MSIYSYVGRSNESYKQQKYHMLLFLITMFLYLLTGCSPQQETITQRTNAIGETGSADSNFQEAAQIKAIEEWKDQKGKVVNLYVFNPATGDLLIPPMRCLGVPVSSTESLEPNNGFPVGPKTVDAWRVLIDGVDTYTQEMTGRDGTFGEPVQSRQCMTVDGHYIDLTAFGNLPHLITDMVLTFPDSTVKRDVETELRLKQAEKIIERGGCVNPETMKEVACE